jgi:hypothetical protein
MDRTAIKIQGAHQFALRLISVNVLLGAIKVSMMRDDSESPSPAGGTAAVEPLGAGAGVVPILSSMTRFLGFARFYRCSGWLSVDVCHKKQLLGVILLFVGNTMMRRRGELGRTAILQRKRRPSSGRLCFF